MFAYGIETACDKNGWIIDFTVNPGNEHDSRTFKGLYDKLADVGMKYCIVDAGYKTPAIAKLLLDDGVKPVFPYKRPMTKAGFFRKSEYVYDEYNDAYICPENHFLHYSTTNRDGYRNTKVVHTFVKSASTFRSVQDDGNTEVFYFKNATATFSSFTHEPEVVKF